MRTFIFYVRFTLVLLLLVGLVLFGTTKAATTEYIVEYTIVAPHETDSSVVTCKNNDICEIKSDVFHLSILLHVPWPTQDEGIVRVYGKPGCCFFQDGTEALTINTSQSTIRLPIFVGRERRGLEILENIPLGVLYLNFK